MEHVLQYLYWHIVLSHSWLREIYKVTKKKKKQGRWSNAIALSLEFTPVKIYLFHKPIGIFMFIALIVSEAEMVNNPDVFEFYHGRSRLLLYSCLALSHYGSIPYIITLNVNKLFELEEFL